MKRVLLKLLPFVFAWMLTAVYATSPPPPPSISGPSPVTVNTAYTYSYSSSFVAAPMWSVTSGVATINSTWTSGTTYYASVTWSNSGTITFFDEVEGGVNASKTVNVYPTAPTPVNGSRCGTGTVQLSATPGAGGSVKWYTALTGGTYLGESTTYTTPSLSTTTTYYIETWSSALSMASSPRTAITATINSIVSQPVSVTNGARCDAGTVTISASPASGANSIKWYSSPVGGDSVGVGLNFVTPSLTESVGYYAASYNTTTKCVSSSRVAVLAEANIMPPAISALSLSKAFGSGTVDLVAFSSTVDRHGNVLDVEIDPTKYEVKWYGSQANALANTSSLGTGITFTTPSLTTSTNFWVRSRDVATNCYSIVGKEITATVIPLITNASIKSDVIRVPGKKTESSLGTLTPAEKTSTVVYLDGMGRIQQQILVKGSPTGKDVVAPVEYDSWGRSSKTYLPYADTTTNGSFHSGYKTEQLNFYQKVNDKVANDTHPFAASVYESSPLGRLVEQGGVGQAWQPGSGHTQKIEYLFNTAADNVRKFNLNGTSSGYYGANILSKTKSIDADGNHTLTFTDGSGNTILVRQWINATIEGTSTDYLETYYLYNDLGQLTYIISPKGVALLKSGSWSFTPTIKDSYCNQFKYDNKGRVIEKKVPGQACQYVIYDPLGRVVLTQDGMLRTTNQWAFIKYDYKGRAIMTGLYTNATQTTRSAVQGIADGLYTTSNGTYGENAWYESRGTTLHGYTNISFPKQNADNSALSILSINYYGSHDFDFNGSRDYKYDSLTFTGQSTTSNWRADNLATGNKRIVIDSSPATWLSTYVFYDERGRVIQTRSNNNLSATIDNLITNIYSFDGTLTKSKNYHNAGSGRITTVINTYEYDTQGRLSKVKQSNNGAGDQILANYTYNGLGQLVDKKLHNTTGTEYLQSVDYRYTIRGQLASINNAALDVNSETNDETTDYFGMELLYNTTESGLNNTGLYNGSISAIKWKGLGGGNGTENQKSYKYAYDKTGKLETATYQAKGTSAWDKEVNAQNEVMTYDHNGNIKSLQRKQRKHQLSGITASYISEDVDNLTYTYNSTNNNSLEKVTDASTVANGFDNGTSGTSNDYTYDANGNLTADLNKGISNIVYNFLGKPTQITFSSGKVINYTYDATGFKLKMSVTESGVTKTTDYVNGFVYENNVLSFFGSPEGRVVKNGSTLEYQYAIADHQGNTRIVFTSAAPTVAAPTTNFESSTSADFQNYTNRTNWDLFDHTDPANDGTDYSQKLTGGVNSQVGVTRSMKVFPGDKVKIEAYAKYYNAQSTASNILGFALGLTGAFGVSSSSTGEALKAYNSLNNYGGIIAAGNGGGNSNYPKLFINILLFDKDFKLLDAAWQQIDGGEQVGATPKAAHDYMIKEVTVKEAGYAYVFVSNESATLVEFYVDDVVVTHTPNNVIQYNEYYPFGLQTAASWTRENTTANNYLYNAANELNQTSGWYEMYYRGYDPATGRMLQIDPYATMYASSTTYNYALNNPVMMNDPSGGQAMAYLPGMSGTGVSRYNRINSMSSPDFNQGVYDSFFTWADSQGGGGSGPINDKDGNLIGYRFSGNAAQNVFVAYKSGADGVIVDSYGNIMDVFNNPSENPSESGPAIACTTCPTGWDRLKTGWKHFGQMWKKLIGADKIPKIQDIAQIIIVGSGNEQFGLKNMGNGRIGVWDLNDDNSVMRILEFTISDNLLDVGTQAVGIFYENPLNEWHGNFFDRTMDWVPSERYPGHYFNTTHNPKYQGYYFTHDYAGGIHTMTKTTIPFEPFK